MDGCLVRVLLLLWLLPGMALADSVNNEWYSTTRALSMGNAGVASAEDPATAMFYNPAAITHSKKFSAEPFNPQVEVGTDVLSTSGLDWGKHGTLNQVRPLLKEKPGSVSSLGMALYPNISAQNFNFGILMRGEGSSYYDGTKLHYQSKYYVIPTMGLSMAAIGRRFRLGVAVRGIQATTNDRSVNGIGSAANGYRIDAEEGFGLGLDAGALLTMPWTALPTFAFVARNIGDTTFPGKAPLPWSVGSVTRKEKIKMTYDAGFALFPKVGRKSVFTMTADYRDILNQSGANALRHFNIGFELSVSKIFYLRAGYGRGYWTAGLGLSSKTGSLDIGSYADEMDAKGLRVTEDRRISIRLGRHF